MPIKTRNVSGEWPLFHDQNRFYSMQNGDSPIWANNVYRQDRVSSVVYGGISVYPNSDSGRCINEPNQTRILASMVLLTQLVLSLLGRDSCAYIVNMTFKRTEINTLAVTRKTAIPYYVNKWESIIIKLSISKLSSPKQETNARII